MSASNQRRARGGLIALLSFLGSSLFVWGSPAANSGTTVAAPSAAPSVPASDSDQGEPVSIESKDEQDGLEPTARAIADAITELDVERARQLFAEVPDAPGLAYQRARLAVYVGDCDSAEASLATLPEVPETLRLARLARTCARATAGALVVDDKQHGVWIRLQDAGDKVLAPLIAEVAAQARETMIKDLGVELPKPIRIDVVRDLFSLASVTGLPVEAAETTGTVAVARWGRVTMISPRAARHGYPWQDTLAHEITHLALTRGSRDLAPLWLQEGIAKREEVRWRVARPFDEQRDPHVIARKALLEGTSVGIDRIGPSIAMLPSPQAAAISYAEVESFMDFWIRTVGREAFTLLLLDLKGLHTRDTDEALLSVTGYPLPYWIARWQEHLRALPEKPEPEADEPHDSVRPAVQSVRLGDLLHERNHVGLTAPYYDEALLGSPESAAVRFRAAAAQVALGESDAARERLGELSKVDRLYGSWLGLHGKMLHEVQQANAAEEAFTLAVAVDPLGEEAACEGVSPRTAVRVETSDAGVVSAVTRPETLPLPNDSTRQRLCEEARKAGRD